MDTALAYFLIFLIFFFGILHFVFGGLIDLTTMKEVKSDKVVLVEKKKKTIKVKPKKIEKPIPTVKKEEPKIVVAKVIEDNDEYEIIDLASEYDEQEEPSETKFIVEASAETKERGTEEIIIEDLVIDDEGDEIISDDDYEVVSTEDDESDVNAELFSFLEIHDYEYLDESVKDLIIEVGSKNKEFLKALIDIYEARSNLSFIEYLGEYPYENFDKLNSNKQLLVKANLLSRLLFLDDQVKDIQDLELKNNLEAIYYDLLYSEDQEKTLDLIHQYLDLMENS